jgi:hypothetical protein
MLFTDGTAMAGGDSGGLRLQVVGGARGDGAMDDAGGRIHREGDSEGGGNAEGSEWVSVVCGLACDSRRGCPRCAAMRVDRAEEWSIR